MKRLYGKFHRVKTLKSAFVLRERKRVPYWHSQSIYSQCKLQYTHWDYKALRELNRWLISEWEFFVYKGPWVLTNARLATIGGWQCLYLGTGQRGGRPGVNKGQIRSIYYRLQIFNKYKHVVMFSDHVGQEILTRTEYSWASLNWIREGGVRDNGKDTRWISWRFVGLFSTGADPDGRRV